MQPVEDTEDRALRREVVQGPGHALPTWLKALLQGRLDQFVLGLEVLVEGHFRHPRLGEDPVDAGGMEAIAIEQRDGGVDQQIAFA
ncbi:hypothetical protein D3C86_1934140 [compost metagenome]